MARKTADFSHRDKFSGYMGVVAGLMPADGAGKTLLDIPAGAGRFGDAMAERGFKVTYCDFNQDRPEFIPADFNARLPFDDGSFDAVTCCEGIEHALSDLHMIGELARVCRPGGTVVITTPNVHHLLSRIQFLLTGTLYQFNPASTLPAPPGAALDRGHITPLTLPRLQYLADHAGLDLLEVRTDKLKRKILIPVHWLLHAFSWPWRRRIFLSSKWERQKERNRRLYDLLYSGPVMLGRTLIGVFRKRGPSSAAER